MARSLKIATFRAHCSAIANLWEGRPGVWIAQAASAALPVEYRGHGYSRKSRVLERATHLDGALRPHRRDAATLKSQGHTVKAYKTWLEHGDSGFVLQPLLMELQPLDNGGVRTVTTMQVNHPTLIPAGTFEYQHSTGDHVADSLSKGFDQWAQTDFVALVDALRAKPLSCTAMEMTFPAKDGGPERVRRAVLGPVMHMAQSPPPPDVPEEHPFCPSCLLTNSFEAFRELLEADAFYGLRLFACRDGNGLSQADCRVNGDDWEKGAQALREYVGKWPPAAGIELRKQYVVLQSVESGSRAGPQPG